MLRSAVSKVMWVGRATVFCVGLSVIGAVVLGVATTALGATGGNFVLGKGNGAGAVTRVTSNIAGPALRLINNDSTSSAATALELQVAAGHAPLTVNSSQKVANLNSDQLDGKSDTDFYAAGTKVSDSELLDGKDPSAFLGADQKASDSEKLDGIDSSDFLGKNERAADSAMLGGQAPSAYGAAVMGRINGVSRAQHEFGAVTGISDATTPDSSSVVMLSPGRDVVLRDFNVQLTRTTNVQPETRDFDLMVNGLPHALSCHIAAPDTTCTSAVAITIPAGSVIYLRVSTQGTVDPTDALFGYRLTAN